MMLQGMSDAIIQVENFGHVYRRGQSPRPALDGLSFAVRRGEIFGLLGPNGAGKTTVVEILTTILRPTSGRALVAGHDVRTHPLEVRRQFAAVLQENAVETLLSTRDNLLLYGYLHGLSRSQTTRRMEEVVVLLELHEHLGQRAQALSGGNKRRLQVAKALMVETPILFLDEATTGMDPLVKRRVVEASGVGGVGGLGQSHHLASGLVPLPRLRRRLRQPVAVGGGGVPGVRRGVVLDGQPHPERDH
jgi:ABC-2 type transport system ATP-binding protein